MKNIVVKVNGSSATASFDGKLTSGMVGLLVSVDYDPSWDSLIKTASFRVGNFVRSRENIGSVTTVPWEVMRHYGKPLEVGVEGRDADGNIIIPTVWASVGMVYEGAVSNVPGSPNPDVGDVPPVAGAMIDDSVIDINKTWSSQKIADEIRGGGELITAPTIDVEEIEGGHRVTVTDAKGEENFDVMDGKDGYTPVKGKDYYTEADKAEMVTAVLAALPTYNGEVEEV
jgi:hypothetical protein